MNSNQHLLLGCVTSLRLTILVSKAATSNRALSKLNSVVRGITKDVAEVSNNCPFNLCTLLRNGNVDVMPRTTLVFIMNKNFLLSVC